MVEVEIIKVEEPKKKAPYKTVRKHYVDPSKYKTPHQGAREMSRRRRQLEAGTK